MTLIIACSWNGKTAIASDSCSGGTMHLDHGRKFALLPFGAVGWSGSYRWFPVVRPALEKIQHVRNQAEAELMMDSIEAALKAKGWTGSDGGKMPQCEDLLGVVASADNGKLWQIYSNMTAYPVQRIATVGCGDAVGRGIAEALRRRKVHPADAAREAVRIAATFLNGVKGKAHVHQIR